MTPDQIEQSVYNDLINFDWESGKSISSATANAQFLFEAHSCFFYVPATGDFLSAEREGNHYHGYETVVEKRSKSEVLNIANKQLAYAQSLPLADNIIAYWENVCSKINEC